MAKILKHGEIEDIINMVVFDDTTINEIVSRRNDLKEALNNRKSQANKIIEVANKLLKNGIGERYLADFFFKKENGGWHLDVAREDCQTQYLRVQSLDYTAITYRGHESPVYFSTQHQNVCFSGYRNFLTNRQFEQMIDSFDVFEDCFFAAVKRVLSEETYN